MSICYFELFNGKPPIVERVKACRPRKSMPHLDGDYWELHCGDRNGTVAYSCQWFTMSEPISTHHEAADIALALTRVAVEDWLVSKAGTLSIATVNPGVEVRLSGFPIGFYSKNRDGIHETLNSAAHALADALGVAP